MAEKFNKEENKNPENVLQTLWAIVYHRKVWKAEYTIKQLISYTKSQSFVNTHNKESWPQDSEDSKTKNRTSPVTFTPGVTTEKQK